MNEPGDIPLTLSSTPDSRPPCSIVSIIPTIGMSSCRGRAEAFARSLSSKLRTLGSQTTEEGANAEDEPIINGTNTNTWVNSHESEQTVTDLQPLRHESDSFFDFDCELESPGSPVDECEYLRLIETASNTPHNSTAESGYACASVSSSHSSTDGPYFEAVSNNNTAQDQLLVNTVSTQQPQRSKLPVSELKEFVIALKMNGAHEVITNGVLEEQRELEQKEEQAQQTQTQTQPQAKECTLPPEEDESKLQAEILSELQQQSENFKSAEIEVVEQNKPQEEQTEEPAKHNGHVEYTEDQQLHIEEEPHVKEEAPAKEEAHAKEETHTEAETHIEEDTKNEIGLDETDKDKSHFVHVIVDGEQLQQAKAYIEERSETLAAAKTSHQHGLDTTDDEDDCRPQRVRRCSSLKTGKTPPGTPGRKKIVRFADVLGLDLADVKTFLDEIPNIPKSAFEDLEILEAEAPMQMGHKSDKLLMPLFQQPGGLTTFLDAVREKQVSLENAAVTDSINQTIAGSVRVCNLDFHKSVHIRYTLDGWRSYADLQANYVENSCDGFSDKFTFVLFGNSLHVGQRLEFAVRFQCKGQQFWDNNYGANYCFQCLPSSSHIASSASAASGSVSTHHNSNLVGMLGPAAGDTWCSSFY